MCWRRDPWAAAHRTAVMHAARSNVQHGRRRRAKRGLQTWDREGAVGRGGEGAKSRDFNHAKETPHNENLKPPSEQHQTRKRALPKSGASLALAFGTEIALHIGWQIKRAPRALETAQRFQSQERHLLLPSGQKSPYASAAK